MRTDFEYALSFNRAVDGRIILSPEIYERFQAFRQLKASALEAGGVLMGRFIQDNNHIAIDFITEPMMGDIRKRLFYFRSATRHQAIVDRVWSESESTCTYLGEWHTHPEDDPSPSSVDLSGWQRKLSQNPNGRNTLIFVIVGRHRLRIWEGFVSNGACRIEEVVPVQI